MQKQPLMTTIVNFIPGIRHSLSTQLLMLTGIVVLVAETIILIPSVAYEQRNWIMMRSQAAYLAGLVIDDSPTNTLNENMLDKVLMSANIEGFTISTDEGVTNITSQNSAAITSDSYKVIDIQNYGILEIVSDAWITIAGGGSQYLRIIDQKTLRATGSNHIMDITLARSHLRKNLRQYALNILGLSLFISLITAFCVFWSLNRLIIKPVTTMRKNMAAFQGDPEAEENILIPSDRFDEIGHAERSLSELEQRLQSLLNERRRLAALGSGISKISHDLRNILASAQLMSDRLVASDDPRVKKLSPRLVDALDRAITLSRETLNYGRISPEILNRKAINLHELIESVFDDNATMYVTMHNKVAEDIKVEIDRMQFYRGLTNIIRNGIDALTPDDADFNADGVHEACTDCDKTITVTTNEDHKHIIVDIADNGPGLPDSAKEFLYEPFKGSNKAGGSGLGLAITAEILRAHGGELRLHKSDESGATFRLMVPKNPPKSHGPKLIG